MSNYIYNDEDNAPMIDEPYDMDGHNPTVYSCRSEERAVESGIPFDEPIALENGCWNCISFDWKHEACTLNWNNMDEDYYNPDVDDRKLTDCCEYHETDPDADPECLMDGGNEP